MIRQICLVAALLGTPALAATLKFAEPGEQPGEKWTVPLLLEVEAGEFVAALQADVEFDEAELRFNSVAPGPAARDADKSANANQLEPGRVRVVVAGVNDRTIPPGVVAEFEFIGNPPQFSLTNALLADPMGQSVPLSPAAAGAAGGVARTATAPVAGNRPLTWLACGGVAVAAVLGLVLATGKKKRRRMFGVLLAAVAASPFAADAALLDVTDAAALPGESDVLVEINLTAGAYDEIGGIQFSVLFDAPLSLPLENIIAGSATEDAQKTVNLNMLSSNEVFVLIAGFNQNIIEDGCVLLLSFDVPLTVSEPELAVTIAGVRISSIYGESIWTQVDNGAIYIEGIAEGEGEEGEGEGEEGEGEGEEGEGEGEEGEGEGEEGEGEGEEGEGEGEEGEGEGEEGEGEGEEGEGEGEEGEGEESEGEGEEGEGEGEGEEPPPGCLGG